MWQRRWVSIDHGFWLRGTTLAYKSLEIQLSCTHARALEKLQLQYIKTLHQVIMLLIGLSFRSLHRGGAEVLTMLPHVTHMWHL